MNNRLANRIARLEQIEADRRESDLPEFRVAGRPVEEARRELIFRMQIELQSETLPDELRTQMVAAIERMETLNAESAGD